MSAVCDRQVWERLNRLERVAKLNAAMVPAQAQEFIALCKWEELPERVRKMLELE